MNGRRITGAVVLQADDLVQFANVAFRIQKQTATDNSHTVQVDSCDRALALVQFDKLMTDHAVTPLFQPIVLMADAQTIGGYPQVAHVIDVDRPLVAQLRPGDAVRFREVPLAEAHELLLARERTLAILHEGLAEKLR